MPYVVIGTGPTAAMIIAQQHGDEMETSDSAIALDSHAGQQLARRRRTIRAELTVVVVPRVNVDGFDGENPDGTPINDARTRPARKSPPWRENYDPASP